MKRIAVLTSGGDSSGMNACIRSVVRSAIFNKLEVLGVIRGYEGLIKGDFIQLNKRSVSGILNRGGTILKTARSKEFMTEAGQLKAVDNLKKNEIDGLVVIGGDGSFRGAHILATKYGVKTIGIPGTIDNDISGTDFSVGTDTALNVALDAIDKIRDTVNSLERIFVIEVMGRESGYIACQVGLAGGVEDIVVPEMKFDINAISEEIRYARKEGKLSWILIVAEGAGDSRKIAQEISQLTGYETRVTILGHIQRGGSPTAMDRILASRFGQAAVTLLLQEKSDLMVGIIADHIEPVEFEYAIQVQPGLNKELYKLIKILAI